MYFNKNVMENGKIITDEVRIRGLGMSKRHYIDGENGPYDGIVDYIYEPHFIKHGNNHEAATKEFTKVKDLFSKKMKKYGIQQK